MKSNTIHYNEEPTVPPVVGNVCETCSPQQGERQRSGPRSVMRSKFHGGMACTPACSRVQLLQGHHSFLPRGPQEVATVAVSHCCCSAAAGRNSFTLAEIRRRPQVISKTSFKISLGTQPLYQVLINNTSTCIHSSVVVANSASPSVRR